MKIIFAGTPEFAVPALEALIHSEHSVTAVFTQPDRPSGRGRQIVMSPVKILANQYQIPVYQPDNLKDPAEQQRLLDLNADVIAVVAYGLLLPKKILDGVKYGAVNVHPSLLPRWRGATPIQSAILAGDAMTGVTIMQLTPAMDAGPILHQSPSPVGARETSEDLHNRLAKTGAQDLLKTLDALARHNLHPAPQEESLATYTKKIVKSDAKIAWEKSAAQLAREVRAYNPWPVSFTDYQGSTLRIWEAEALAQTAVQQPGVLENIAPNGLDIATAEGVLRLITVQSPGGRPLAVAEWIRAQKEKLKTGVTQFRGGL